MVGLMENDASVEICKKQKRRFPRAAWKSLRKKRFDFPTFPTSPASNNIFLGDKRKTNEWDREPTAGYEKEKPRPGYVGMGFIPNPRQ
jgi:hypothetical protein